MSIYPAKITAIIAKKSRDSIINNGEGRAVSFACGSMVNIRLRIDTATKNIAEMAFSSNGCGYMVAAAQSLADEFNGRSLKDLHGAESDEIASVIERRTGELPASKKQCLDTAIEAFRNAVADHRMRVVEEYRGEVALICSCFGVSEERINDVIRETQAADPSDVARACNAGNGCGSCRMLIQELIDTRHVE